jgi:hypothetical protein
MSQIFSLVSILLCHHCACVSNISISLFIFATYISKNQMSFNTSQCTSSSALLLGVLLECSAAQSFRFTTHTCWCGSVAVICSVEKTSIPITAFLASCKECPTRSDGTHTVAMQETLHQDVSGHTSDCTTTLPFLRQSSARLNKRSIFKIHKFIHGHGNATYLFSSL